MVTIQIDEQTASYLEQQARLTGMSIADYLRALLPTSSQGDRPSWDELESRMQSLSTAGPSLPADFSRADLYLDHD